MRVGIVCAGGLVSGKEIMALSLAEGLRCRGHALEFATSSWSDGEFQRRLAETGFRTHRMRLGFISATLDVESQRMTAVQAAWWPALLWSYGRFVHTGAFERVIHTNWHHLLLLWPRLSSARDLFWVHEVVPDKPQYRRVFGGLARRLQGFVAVSHAVARSLVRLGIPESQVHVVHNGLPDPGPVTSARDGARQRVGIVGRIGDWKGHEDLIAAFESVVAGAPGAELHVFGEGARAYETRLRTQAAERGLGARITWHGFVRERAAIYPEIDVCAVPSRSEDSLPTVAIEAALFGLPVVATRLGGLPEIVEDGVTGCLVEPGNRGALAERLLGLLRDADRRRTLGLRARELALERFGECQFLDAFDRLLGAGRPSA